MIDHPSPNHEPRPPGRTVDMLVIHYTGMPGAQAALERLCDPAAKVSAHYLIDEDGVVYRLVPEERRAWHAGVSAWRGQRDINDRSIGIELANPGHEFGYLPFTNAQMAALVGLSTAILSRHPIPPRNVVGHSDIAPTRKQDPGELFDWPALARVGVGLWPFRGQPLLQCGRRSVAEVQSMLLGVGYQVPLSGNLDADTIAALVAFQRRFRPARVDGYLDDETVARAQILHDFLLAAPGEEIVV